MRYVIITVLALMMFGCATPRTHTEYQKVYIPTLYCPAPPDIIAPEFYANQLTEEQLTDIGELTKAYVVSAQQSLNYNASLRAVYNLYVDLAEKSEARLKAIEAMGGTVDRSMIDQANRELGNILSSISAEIEFQNETHSTQMLQSLNQMKE